MKLQILQAMSRKYGKQLNKVSELKLQIMLNIAKRYNRELLYKYRDKARACRNFSAWDYVIDFKSFIIYTDTRWLNRIYIEYTKDNNFIMVNSTITIKNSLENNLFNLRYTHDIMITSNRAQQQMTFQTIDYLLSLEKG